MAKPAVITQESYDALDESAQGDYIELEVEGAAESDPKKYIFDLEPVDGYGLENTQGLKTALQKERTRADGAEKKVKVFEDQLDGLDLDAARKALLKAKEIENWKPDEKVQKLIDERVSGVSEKLTKERDEANTKVDSLQTELNRVLIQNAGTLSIAKAKGNVKLLLPHIAGQMKVIQENGHYVARVMDADGSVRITTKPNSTDPMDVDELVELTKKEFPEAYEGTRAGGTGTGGGEGGGPGGEHTITRADAKDPIKYRAAADAAEKAGRQLQIVD